VDNTKPQTMNIRHLNENLKKKQLKEERFQEIERENKLLLQRMTQILTNEDEPYADYQWRMKSLNSVSRKQNLRKINSENESILKRLGNSKSHYDRSAWEDECKERKAMVERIRKVHYEPGENSQLLPATIHDIEILDASSIQSLQKVRAALASAGLGRSVKSAGSESLRESVASTAGLVPRSLRSSSSRPSSTGNILPRRLEPVRHTVNLSSTLPADKSYPKKMSHTKALGSPAHHSNPDLLSALATPSQRRSTLMSPSSKKSKRFSVGFKSTKDTNEESYDAEEFVTFNKADFLKDRPKESLDEFINSERNLILVERSSATCLLKKVGTRQTRHVKVNIKISRTPDDKQFQIRVCSKVGGAPVADAIRAISVEHALELCPDSFHSAESMEREDLAEVADKLADLIQLKDLGGKIKVMLEFIPASPTSKSASEEPNTCDSGNVEAILLFKGGRRVGFINKDDIVLPSSRLLMLLKVEDSEPGYIVVTAWAVSKMFNVPELSMTSKLPTLAVVDRDAAVEFANHLVSSVTVERKHGKYRLCLGKVKGNF